MADAYTPATGLKDVTAFPSKPVSGAAARKQIQDMLDQILAFHNNHIDANTSDTSGVHGFITRSDTYTPVLAGSTTPGTNTYDVQNGQYYRKGDEVTVWFNVRMTAKDALIAGAIKLTGFPFTNVGPDAIGTLRYWKLNTVTSDVVHIRIPYNLNYAVFDYSGDDIAQDSIVGVEALTDTTYVSGTITYRIE